MSELQRKDSELSSSELCRLLECKEEELDDFEEVDLTYLSSDVLTFKYDTIPALDSLRNLERLTICCHNIQDLTPIKRLSKLKYVNISRNAISNIKPLTSLCLLEELHLDYNNICLFPRVFAG
ncbi:hypothetical protein JH06_3806 [Blastocystis sp. subtype 4]|uniref:hypothetical protein n=1 Tax=Blastocystis sp. subtype 4 TaxID=944170 RepID=UPI000711A087|nr:hypothetical protein JH06_3806 [Blastocystis sp. subtype 4]KNB44901.1 hypothetical protein JH06_3806 [Blastocystis sp. subtype 4]|eukprot:XP_014528344.1 hypothetical protein JH06_3806 [Blastocystis sp. subtype 4]